MTDSQIEQISFNKAKKIVAKERGIDREKKVQSFLNKIIPLDEVRTGKLSKFVFESL